MTTLDDLGPWLDPAGPSAAFARIVDAEGLGPLPTRAVLVITARGGAGALLGAEADLHLAGEGRAVLAGDATGARLVRRDVDDAAALGAGLTCGGRVSVLVQALADVPAAAWAAAARRRPVVLVTRPGHPGASLVVGRDGSSGTLGDDVLDAAATELAAPLLARPGHQTRVVDHEGTELVLEGWAPLPRLVVVGPNQLADSLVAQVELLGWSGSVTALADDAVAAVGAMGPLDGVVVLDHSPAVATPVLTAALGGDVGYVGALGSRRTQAARRTHLERAGVGEEALARLHGPAGLDLGGSTPQETALSIVAEMIALRTGRGGSPLHNTSGAIKA